MSFRFASFNMYKYQAYRSDNEIRKNIGLIARIIRESEIDIIGLQEIFSKTAMDLLIRELGRDYWTGHHEIPLARTASAAEGYAFVWNTRRFRPSSYVNPRGEERVFSPRIYYQYRVDWGNGQASLIRNPLFGRFTPLSCPECEFRLINAHIMYNRSVIHEELNPRTNELPDPEMRRNEHRILARALYPTIADKVYGNGLPSYTILMGDYNLNLIGSNAGGPYISPQDEVFLLPGGARVKCIRTVQEKKTTLKRPPQDDSAPDPNANDYWANNYDHFTYDVNRFEGIGVHTDRVNSVGVYCKDYVEHRKVISDHVPIIIDIDLRGGK